jgi:hypothetical protein
MVSHHQILRTDSPSSYKEPWTTHCSYFPLLSSPTLSLSKTTPVPTDFTRFQRRSRFLDFCQYSTLPVNTNVILNTINMRFELAAAAALAAGAQASVYGYNGTAPTYVTEVVTAYTTYCPTPTVVSYGGQTITVTSVC